MSETEAKSEAIEQRDPHPDAAVQNNEKPFPVVGIGASAGGLAAFESFFSGMPSDVDSGMAFVLVQHLAPDHKSILTDLVKRYTRMQVTEAEDGMTVKPNCAYIIPPNRDMAFSRGSLQLLEPSAPRGKRLPIDFFFRSLAQDQRERAICIVLSGTGSDGTLGVRAVKGEGGMAMAQTPESTEYDGMPRSAIATGLIDYVLAPPEMPAQLLAYVCRRDQNLPRSLPAAEPAEDELQKVFILLRAQTGHDFSLYKRNTIVRRVERRMAIAQVDQLDAYLRFLSQTPGEVDALFRDLLIGVTSFFRDPEAYAALEQHLLAQLLANKSENSMFRVWVPGCSTGEEAYSLAILLREKLEQLELNSKLQIFATDLDAKAIETARLGLYPASISADVTPERLARNFIELESGDYRIQKSIRDLLIFSEQDVIKDPPFSKLDLLSCRNLMIYLGAELQQKLIPLFHYALNPQGILFLGTSETVGEFSELFTTLDRKAKLFQKRPEVVGALRPQLGSVRAAFSEPTHSRLTVGKSAVESSPSFREITERTLLTEAPAAALVDALGEIFYIHGHTGLYLEPAPGEAGVNILKMARQGLRHDLTTALHKAATQNERVHRPGLQVKTNGHYVAVDLAVVPALLHTPGLDESPTFLVVFRPGQAASAPHTSEHTPRTSTDAEISRINTLERELRTKDEYLHATQEEMQTANEELKSANEELQSTNEELQSTNEELETSKEELQSVNEELATVNTELQSKVSDLSRINNDMNNLLAGTGIGTVFVDRDACIQRFTPTVTQFINLIPSDKGRPLGHIVSNLGGYDRLGDDVQEVLDTLTPREVEVQTGTGASYLLRIRPYRTLDNVVEGAVITFTEVTLLKNAQAALRDSKSLARIANLVRETRDAVVVQDLDGRILVFNPSAVRMYGWTEQEALTMNITSLMPESGRDAARAEILRLSCADELEPYATQRLTKDGRLVNIRLFAGQLVNANGAVYAVSTTERRMVD